jgi:hypothetical protein
MRVPADGVKIQEVPSRRAWARPRRDRALSPLRSDRAAYQRLVPAGTFARAGGLEARMRPPAKIFILRGKGRAAPSPPQRQSAGPWLGCACARTTPADSRCPPRPRLFATTAGPMAEAIALRR